MPRYQIQERSSDSPCWQDAGTNVDEARSKSLAISRAKVNDSFGYVVGKPKLVRVVRVGRFTGQVKELVWASWL